MLSLAEKYHLDVPQITKCVVEIIRKTSQEDITEEINNIITFEDLKKISAIEWLCFDPSQRHEALYQSNLLAGSFIASKKLEAAKKLFEEILPEDSVAVVLENYFQHNERSLIKIKKSIKEHLCIRAYLECYKTHLKWYLHHTTSPFTAFKSNKLEDMNGKFTEQIVYESRLTIHQDESMSWEETDKILSTKTKEAIYKVLTYPRGWLVDDEIEVQERNEEDHYRTLQLENLRKHCIPDLFFLLHQVLFETKCYRESILLANLIADDHHKLFLLFTEEELEQFLILIKKNYLEIMERS